MPLSPGRAERHGFEYFRHGTLSLYAAFDTKTGEVLGKTAVRHTSAEFVAFLADIVVNQPRGKEIHVIADNLSAHKTGQVDDFLDRHPKVHLHFTPTYSSWLNQIELWFAKIERDVIARGVFTSVSESEEKALALHPALQQVAPYRKVEICRSIAPSQYTISWYRPLVPGLEPFALLPLLKCSDHVISFNSVGSFQEVQRAGVPQLSAEIPFGTLSSDFSSRCLTPAQATGSELIFRASDVPVRSPFACHSLYRHFSFFDDRLLIVAICSFICGYASISARGRTFSEVPASECSTRERWPFRNTPPPTLKKYQSLCDWGFWHRWCLLFSAGPHSRTQQFQLIPSRSSTYRLISRLMSSIGA